METVVEGVLEVVEDELTEEAPAVGALTARLRPYRGPMPAADPEAEAVTSGRLEVATLVDVVDTERDRPGPEAIAREAFSVADEASVICAAGSTGSGAVVTARVTTPTPVQLTAVAAAVAATQPRPVSAARARIPAILPGRAQPAR